VTKYMSAKKLAVAPWMEIYLNEGPAKPPTALAYSPALPGPVTKVKFSVDQQMMAVVSSLRREDVPGLGNPENTGGDGTNSGSTAGQRIFSPDDKYILFTGTITEQAALYEKLKPVAFDAVPEVGDFFKVAAISPDANWIAVILNSEPNEVLVWQKSTGEDGSSWASLNTLTVTGDPDTLEFLGSDYLFCTQRSGAGVPVHYLWQMIDDMPVVANPPGSDTRQILRTIQRVDSTYWFYISLGTAFSVYELTGTAWTLKYSRTLPGTFASIRSMDAAKNGDVFALYAARGGGGAGANAFMYVWNEGGGYYTELYSSPATDNYNTTGSVFFSPAGNVLVVAHAAGGAPGEIWSVSGANVMTKVKEVPTASGAGFKGFSDNARIAHFYSDITELPTSTVAPYDPVTTFPWAVGVDPLTIHDFTISPSGRVVLWRDSDDVLQGATQDGGGGFLDFRDIQGVFVTLYDVDEAGGVPAFVERTFSQHVLGTTITDIVFSKTSKLFSYHAGTEDPERITGLGRFVYWIEDKEAAQMDLLGAEWQLGDTSSFLAFSPNETHFVVVYGNATANDYGAEIRLYKFGAGYVYTQEDAEPVLYGPAAYSACETIVVAHGGMQPYTLFIHTLTPEALVKTDVFVKDWTNDSVILAVAYTSDCSGVVIVTPGDIIVVGGDNTGEDEEPEIVDQVPTDDDEEPDDGEDEEEVEIIQDGDDSDIIIVVVDNDTDPKPWEIDDKTINQIQYISYVSVNVTFRTW